MNIFALIDQRLPFKPLQDFLITISRCASYTLLAKYLVWLLKPFKEIFRFFYKGFFSNSCYLLMSHVTCHMSYITCHMSHVPCHISDVTRHVSSVANAIVIFLQADYFISTVKSFNFMLNSQISNVMIIWQNTYGTHWIEMPLLYVCPFHQCDQVQFWHFTSGGKGS